MGIGVRIEEVQQMASVIGCEGTMIPFVYLGVRIGANMNHIAGWQDVINKFKSRMSKWKAKTLSVGGRLTLIKAVLGSVAIYNMSIFKTPITIINTLESIRNNFFLGADVDERKLTWVKWKKTLASKKDGGLGIGSLYGFNRALLYKWKWRFLDNPTSLWVKVIKILFGQDGGLGVNMHCRNVGSIWLM